ncbi:NUDIX domain-containing protein [Streptomyces sp. NPDC127103]|uniref:NUDIX domain-containing protein n=1 Tax=Streptomyces sp. NPDC127103 TaxID=3347139 RepID=UPI0036525A7B
MPPSLSPVHDLLTAYLAEYPDEHPALSELLNSLDTGGDPTSRATLPGHITCSAVVIDRAGRVLHVRHKASGLLLAPGGHVEASDASLLAAALREVEEETGLPASSLALTPEFRDHPIDIGVHDIDARPSKAEPAHRHYDVRFVFCLADDALSPTLTLQAEEVGEATWLTFDEVCLPALRAKLARSGLDGAIVPMNAAAVVHDGRGRYLLHLRDANKPEIWQPGAWSLLGGGREPQDGTLLDTVRRELREEAGLEITDLKPYGVEHAIGTEGMTVPIQVFTGTWGGDPSALRLTEGVMLAWMDPGRLPFLTMAASTRELIERHAAEHAAPAAGLAAGAEPGAQAPEPPGTVPHIVGVHLYLEHEGRILLGRRHPDSAYAGGSWHALAGHCEAESATACLVREAYEEAGLVIDRDDLELVHTVHVVDRPAEGHAEGYGGRSGCRPPRIQLFFRACRWEGTPELREPDKCVAWQWWNPKDLPEPIVPYARAAIEGVQAGRPYTEWGWTR